MSEDDLQEPLPKFILRTPEQIRALGAPATHDVFLGLLKIGRGAIADIAPIVGKSPHALYHHMDKLVDVGLVRVDGEQRKGARTEKIYRPVAHLLFTDPENNDPQYRAALIENAVAQTRRAGNAIKKAHQEGKVLLGEAKANSMSLQVTVSLDQEQRAMLFAKINQLIEDTARQSGTTMNGEDLLFTVSIAPKS